MASSVRTQTGQLAAETVRRAAWTARLRDVFATLIDLPELEQAERMLSYPGALLTSLRVGNGALPLLVETPEEAWEALATRGLIPASWTTEPRRAFGEACPHCDGEGYSTEDTYRCDAYPDGCHGAGWVPRAVPPRFDLVVAFALAHVRMATAEALARQLVANLAGISPYQPDLVLWRRKISQRVTTSPRVYACPVTSCPPIWTRLDALKGPVELFRPWLDLAPYHVEIEAIDRRAIEMWIREPTLTEVPHGPF